MHNWVKIKDVWGRGWVFTQPALRHWRALPNNTSFRLIMMIWFSCASMQNMKALVAFDREARFIIPRGGRHKDSRSFWKQGDTFFFPARLTGGCRFKKNAHKHICNARKWLSVAFYVPACSALIGVTGGRWRIAGWKAGRHLAQIISLLQDARRSFTSRWGAVGGGVKVSARVFRLRRWKLEYLDKTHTQGTGITCKQLIKRSCAWSCSANTDHTHHHRRGWILQYSPNLAVKCHIYDLVRAKCSVEEELFAEPKPVVLSLKLNLCVLHSNTSVFFFFFFMGQLVL